MLTLLWFRPDLRLHDLPPLLDGRLLVTRGRPENEFPS
jgi:hypothetical protein